MNQRFEWLTSLKASTRKILNVAIIFVTVGAASPLSGQPGIAFDMLSSEIDKMILPLAVLIDSALANNPYVKFRDLQVIANEHKLKANRSEWLRNIGVQSDIRYGTFDNLSINNAGGQLPSTFITTRTETKYGYAAYIKFPIYDFVNRRNQINLAKTEIEQAEQMAMVQRDEVRQLVIRQYNDLILKHKLMKIKLNYLETSKVNFEMAEKEFKNGIISIDEYSRFNEFVSRAEAEFETSLYDFITVYMILEEITGLKFNLR